MTLAWIESHKALARHPKTRKAARMLDVSIPAVIGHLQLLWWWATDYAPDGDLHDYDAYDIAEAALWEGDAQAFVDALVGCGPGGRSGFLDEYGDALRLHDWKDFAGKQIEQNEADKERKRKARRPSVAPSAPRPEDVRDLSATCPADGDGTADVQTNKQTNKHFNSENPETKQDPSDEEQPETKAQKQFKQLWATYPKPAGRDKGSKSESEKQFLKLTAKEREAALAGVAIFRDSDEARNENGRFIPKCERWIREKRWEAIEDQGQELFEDVPPAEHAWEKDQRGKWKPLARDPVTNKFPYGAATLTQAREINEQRWEAFDIARRQNGSIGAA